MREKVLITVKTYPTLSKKYAELVCTAGVNESGEWRRLYPVRFRQLYDEKQYKKYQWVEAELEKSETDKRPESFKIVGDSLQVLGSPLPPGDNWDARRTAFLDRVQIHTDLAKLISLAHRNELSLAAFKPARIHAFIHEAVEREWNSERLAVLEKEKRQLRLFETEEDVIKQFEVVNKLPYKFSYRFQDINGKTSTLMIEDWEIGALFWNCLASNAGDEDITLRKVRDKYWGQFVESGVHDITLLLGTTLEHHQKRSPNPFLIIGLFYPKVDKQERLF